MLRTPLGLAPRGRLFAPFPPLFSRLLGNLFVLFAGFPPSGSGNFYADFFIYSTKCPLTKVRWSFLRGYALLCDIFLPIKVKNDHFLRYYALLCDIFYLRGPSEEGKSFHIGVFLLYVAFFYVNRLKKLRLITPVRKVVVFFDRPPPFRK